MLKCVGFDGEEDEVEGLWFGAEFVGGDESRLEGGVAERADDLEAVAELFCAPLADEEGDVAADLSEAATEESAGCSGADYKNAHVSMVAEKQVPFGNDKKKGNRNSRNKYRDPSTTLHFVTLRSG
jgi:hypothetical protein